ncbi:Hypothetical predicted protein [Paramuricea clavata]|uniref:Uncharacterized protein n=1 Tax=Paramuricea clavata TaxID=317549 RepID=A0A7D9EEY1_PARCT|nr:Hypothetical predicted protein [Paramuricea clavata]
MQDHRHRSREEKEKEELEKAWIDKKMYGQYNRDLGKEVDREKTWWWLKKGDLKPELEALLCAAQEQALRTNYVKFHIDRTVESPLCRLCGEKGEHKTHLIKKAEKWYEHQPNGVIESDNVKILWDFNIQCDHVIECRRPDIVVVLKKEKECKIIDIAVPGDCRIGIKETEKDQVKPLWRWIIVKFLIFLKDFIYQR